MTRAAAIARVEEYFDGGGYFGDLARRVAIRTESQNPESVDELHRYLDGEMRSTLEPLGFVCEVFANPLGARRPPFLIARRDEAAELRTVFVYGHGDVVLGDDERWSEGRSPWHLARDGDRWYGRGTADNKGQHSINLAAIAAVLAERDRSATTSSS